MRRKLAACAVAAIVMMIATAAWAHEGHQHVAEPSGLSGWIDPSLLGFSGLKEVFNVHPVFVHFPIALFPSALLLYGLGFLLKRPSWTVAGRACLYLAAAGAALAVFTGWQAQGSFPHNARIHHMMMTHLSIGVMIGVLALALVIWSFLQRGQQPKGAYAFLALLAATTGLVLQNGDIGSRMVYMEGAAVKPAVSIITGEYRHPGSDSGEYVPHHNEPPVEEGMLHTHHVEH